MINRVSLLNSTTATLFKPINPKEHFVTFMIFCQRYLWLITYYHFYPHIRRKLEHFVSPHIVNKAFWIHIQQNGLIEFIHDLSPLDGVWSLVLFNIHRKDWCFFQRAESCVLFGLKRTGWESERKRLHMPNVSFSFCSQHTEECIMVHTPTCVPKCSPTRVHTYCTQTHAYTYT